MNSQHTVMYARRRRRQAEQDLVDEFEVTSALALVGAATVFLGLGALTFRLGMRRYTSGAVWTRA